MIMTQAEKGMCFRELHQAEGVLLVPNPWDGGSARMLEHLGFKALATSSSASAATLGRRDGKISRAEALAHVSQIVQATNLPVSADLESGFVADPAAVAETIRLAAQAGLVGASIEDHTGDKSSPQFEISLAAERIAAAVEAARALPFPFTLTARAENFFSRQRQPR